MHAASTVTELSSNTSSGGVDTLVQGMGLVSPSRNYVLYALAGSTGQAVVQRLYPDGSLGTTVWQSSWPNALKASAGSAVGG